MWRKPFILACWLCLGLLMACSEQDTTPKGSFIFADGTETNLADYRGRWVVINYWATWCKPCLKEIPHFNRLHDDRRNSAVVIGVDFDNSQDAVLAGRIQQMGIRFPVVTRDPAAGLDHTRPTVLPTTVIYNPQGELSTILLGDQTWESLEAALDGTGK